MSRRSRALVSSEEVTRNASAAIARALLLEVQVDRPKLIDQHLDYFGSGGESGRSPRIAPTREPSPLDPIQDAGLCG